jgi:hypothetical protein
MKATFMIYLFTLCLFWSCSSNSTSTIETATLKYELQGNLVDGYAVEYTDPNGTKITTGPAAVAGGWTKEFTVSNTGACYSIKAGGAYQGGNTLVNIYLNGSLVASKQCNCMFTSGASASACY